MTARLPGAMVIGAPKAGTTTLCAALSRVPRLWMYPRKETHFFNHHYEARGMDWYADLFAPAPDDHLIMEGTPDYAMSNHVAASMRRMRRHMPDARLIYMTRDPVARIESHYVQMVANVRHALPIGEALAKWPEIVETSDYAAILRVIHDHFPPEQVHVLSLEDYRADRRFHHAGLLRFLGLPPDPATLDAMAHQRPLHRRRDQAMDGALLARLRRLRSYDRLNAMVPKPIVRMGKRVLRRRIEVDSTLPGDLRASLAARLDPPWTALRAAYAPAGASS